MHESRSERAENKTGSCEWMSTFNMSDSGAFTCSLQDSGNLCLVVVIEGGVDAGAASSKPRRDTDLGITPAARALWGCMNELDFELDSNVSTPLAD
jgi:hypothetical protein